MAEFEISYENRKKLQEQGSYVADQAVILLDRLTQAAYSTDLYRSCDYGEAFNEAIAGAVRRYADKCDKSDRPNQADQASIWRAVADLFDPSPVSNSYSPPDRERERVDESQNETGEKSQEI